MKFDKFTDICMTGGIRHTPSHTNVTRLTTEKPSGNDLENINKTVEELMQQNVISPVELKPIWIPVDCKLCSLLDCDRVFVNKGLEKGAFGTY